MPTINRKRMYQKDVPYKHDSNSAKYYNSIQWKRLRNYYIRRHPLCEECLSKGIVKPAEECHHKRPFLLGVTEEDRWTLLTDEDNLRALCKECHDEAHRRLNNIRKINAK